MTGVWRVDDLRPVLAALHERGIRPDDPGFAGELRRLFESPGIRLRYCRRAGLLVDEVSELLEDRGFTVRRLSPAETVDVLSEILSSAAPKRKSRIRPAKAAIDGQVRHAAGMRLRKFVCPGCSQIARASKNAALCCGLCLEMTGETVRMVRMDPLPEEILAAAAAEMESAA